jgi:hypothetical protein
MVYFLHFCYKISLQSLNYMMVGVGFVRDCKLALLSNCVGKVYN